MCTVCLLLFLCHAYSSLSPSTAKRQAKLFATVEKKVKKGEFRPSGVRQQEIEAVFSAVLEDVNSSIVWIKNLHSSKLPPVSSAEIEKAKRMWTLKLVHKKFIATTENGTTPRFWQVMNSAKPSAELLDAAYNYHHIIALSLKTAGADVVLYTIHTHIRSMRIS